MVMSLLINGPHFFRLKMIVFPHTWGWYVRWLSVAHCWKRSLRGWGHWLSPQLDLGNWRPLTLPCPWNVHTAHSSCTRSHSKSVALREEDVVETIWKIHVIEPSKASVSTVKILTSECGDLVLQPKMRLVGELPCLWKPPPTILEPVSSIYLCLLGTGPICKPARTHWN